MVIFPHCKINLGLRVTRKREDGFHDLQTIFYPIPLLDVLEIIDSPDKTERNFSCSGLKIQGNPENNLCLKAVELLKNEFPSIPPISMHLHKNIPMGAGLGGGSSDGAFTLRLLNQKYQLGIGNSDLLRYAAILGSDSPFFIQDKPVYAEGRGEKMEEIELDLSSYSILLVSPGIHISTAEAFSRIIPIVPVTNMKELIKTPVSNWKNCIFNDFEYSITAAYPEILTIKEKLYAVGAVYASMTGTGSTVYGIFQKDELPEIQFNDRYRIDKILLSP